MEINILSVLRVGKNVGPKDGVWEGVNVGVVDGLLDGVDVG